MEEYPIRSRRPSLLPRHKPAVHARTHHRYSRSPMPSPQLLNTVLVNINQEQKALSLKVYKIKLTYENNFPTLLNCNICKVGSRIKLQEWLRDLEHPIRSVVIGKFS